LPFSSSSSFCRITEKELLEQVEQLGSHLVAARKDGTDDEMVISG